MGESKHITHLLTWIQLTTALIDFSHLLCTCPMRASPFSPLPPSILCVRNLLCHSQCARIQFKNKYRFILRLQVSRSNWSCAKWSFRNKFFSFSFFFSSSHFVIVTRYSVSICHLIHTENKNVMASIKRNIFCSFRLQFAPIKFIGNISISVFVTVAVVLAVVVVPKETQRPHSLRLPSI